MSVTVPNGGYRHFDDQSGSGNSRIEYEYLYQKFSSTSEIEEVEEEESPSDLFSIDYRENRAPLESIKEEYEGSLFSLDDFNCEDDSVYVAVGKSESSMDALCWSLKHAVNQFTTVYLLHVYPEIRYIPSPLGNLPKNRVSPEMVKLYEDQERGKRTELLQKFLDKCSASKVKAETVLLESDIISKAILDIIPILNIRKLVIGLSKSSPRKSWFRRGNVIADEVFQNAMDSCEIKIVCEGREIMEQMVEIPSPRVTDVNVNFIYKEEDSVSRSCF